MDGWNQGGASSVLTSCPYVDYDYGWMDMDLDSGWAASTGLDVLSICETRL